MPSLIALISVLLIFGGLFSLWVSIHRKTLARGLEWFFWCLAAAGLVAVRLRTEFQQDADSVALVALSLGLLICVFNWFSQQEASCRSGLLLGAGILGACASMPTDFTRWVAVVCLLIPWMLRQADHLAIDHSLTSILWTGLTYTAMLSVGYWGLINLPGEQFYFSVSIPLGSLMMVLLMCGLGGLLDWFPFPLSFSASQGDNLARVPEDTLLPCLAAACFLFRIVSIQQPLQSGLSILAVAGLFTTLITAIKLFGERQLAQRVRLSIYSAFSCSSLSVCLVGWEQLHPERNWAGTSNVPVGEELFLAILIVETVTVSLVLIGFQWLTMKSQHEATVDDLRGARSAHPLVGFITLLGVLSLAGLPPLPGGWWRFEFITSLLMPHEKSYLTGLTEPHGGFVALAVCAILLFALLGAGQIGLLQMFFMEADRQQGRDNASARYSWALVLITAILCAVSLAPFQIIQFFKS